ncbi:MAG TPA: CADD family putative folate metabolism protein [Candidatus Limnocylindrales bacterium]|nr:CADD family putative folate metabolism protein [Candidatus Limnocylindrales bacterium]
MDLIERIDKKIDERHLLTHPFYTKWTEGTLPREALQEYARQYFAFESAFPRLLSAMHARTESAEVRQQLLDNLWDEEHGPDNHAELWLRFAEGIGVDRDDVRSAPRNDATQALVDMYEKVCREAPVEEGVAALYAYERQVPEVAGSKIDGLKKHFSVDDPRALEFFVVHGELDVEHSAAEREMLRTLITDAQPEPIEQATSRALDAWWNFLTAVDQPAAEPVTA